MSLESYRMAVASLTGISDAPLTASDRAAITKALSALDSVFNEAQGIKSKNSSLWSKLKSSLTDAQLDAANYEVDSLGKAVKTAHDKANKVLSDANATHEQAVSLLQYMVDISDLSVLRETSGRNDLLKLSSDVAKDTAHDVAEKTKGGAGNLWDWLPWYGKVGVGLVGAGIVWDIYGRVTRR